MMTPTWQTPKYHEFVKFYELLDTTLDEFPYFQSLPHGNIANYETHTGRVINFSSYDYLGLGEDPRTKEAAAQAIDSYGCSAGASRIVSGELDVHHDLEAALAGLLSREDAIALVGGYSTNVSVLGFLFDESDILISDHLAHDSIATGARLSGAKHLRFAHNDVTQLENLLHTNPSPDGRVVVCIEGLYSMDGDLPPLREIAELKERYGFLLFLDEAHSVGTIGRTGRGVVEHFDLDPELVDIQMGSLSKTFGSCGGYIAGSRDLIRYLKCACPGFVFSTGLPGPLAAAALRAVQLLTDEPERVSTLQTGARTFKQALALPMVVPETPIVPVLADHRHVYHHAYTLKKHGVRVFPISYPAVPKDAARLRFFLSALHSSEDLLSTAELVNATISKEHTGVPH